jgi:predicted nucleotidyltransferase component of viral defense system
MIDSEIVNAWRANAPWREPSMVEQDLVLSRALVVLFSQPLVRETCTLRGGTALNKLVFAPPARYSEDIDLVQEIPGPIGALLDVVRACLDPWLGRARFETNQRMNTLVWRFQSSAETPVALRLKVEINSREHGWVGRPEFVPYSVSTPWFSGTADVATVSLPDLLATKLRALYQRRKGRDLFDLHTVMERFSDLDWPKVVSGFRDVMAREGRSLSWQDLVANMETKLSHRLFAEDVPSLLPSGEFDAHRSWAVIAPRLQAAWSPA